MVVVVSERVTMVKKYHAEELRVRRSFLEQSLLRLAEGMYWSKWMAGQTRRKGGIQVPFGCSFPSPSVCLSCQTLRTAPRPEPSPSKGCPWRHLRRVMRLRVFSGT